MRTIRGMPTAALPLVLSALLLVSACSPDTLIILDPILAASTEDGDALSADLAAVVRANDRRPRVVILEDVSADHVREVVAASPAQLVFAPALLSGVVASVAETFPDRRFYLLGSEAELPLPTVQSVPFDRLAAFEQAGEVAAETADGRIVGLFLVDSPRRAKEADAFADSARNALQSQGRDPNRLSVRRFPSPPDSGVLRDAVSESVRDANQGAITVFAFFLGSGNGSVWELLEDRSAVRVITEVPFAVSRRAPRLLGWIETRWGDAVLAGLDHAESRGAAPPVAAARFFLAPTSNSALNLMMDSAED